MQTAEMQEIGRTREPGQHRAPAEPPQCARRDVLGDACAAGSALVAGSVGQRRDLHEIEVIQQADPGDAGQDMNPDDETARVEGNSHGCGRDNDSEDDAADYRAAYGIQWVHWGVSLQDVFVMARILDQFQLESRQIRRLDYADFAHIYAAYHAVRMHGHASWRVGDDRAAE